MRICGIDPGLAATGYGVIDIVGTRTILVTTGAIQSVATDPLATRLKAIHSGIADLLRAAQPELVVLEELYSHYEHPTTAILMGHVRGVIMLAASAQGFRVEQYPPTHIKKAVTGHGHASKEQVQRMVQVLLGLPTALESEDATDALAVAMTHAHTLRAPAAAGAFK